MSGWLSHWSGIYCVSVVGTVSVKTSLERQGALAILRSVRLSVPRRSCLGYRHAGCLQLSHRRPPEMCGLRTRPRTDVDPPRLLPPSNCHRRRGHIVSPPPGAIPCQPTNDLLYAEKDSPAIVSSGVRCLAEAAHWMLGGCVVLLLLLFVET